jgi:hypothetical protein
VIGPDEAQVFRDRFFGADRVSADRFRQTIERIVDRLVASLPDESTRTPCAADLPALVDLLQRGPEPQLDRWSELRPIVRGSVPVWEATTAAHLECPVLIPALAAEVVAGSLNQSMDSFDQAPAATKVEQQVVAWLCDALALPATAGGTFTTAPPGSDRARAAGPCNPCAEPEELTRFVEALVAVGEELEAARPCAGV